MRNIFSAMISSGINPGFRFLAAILIIAMSSDYANCISQNSILDKGFNYWISQFVTPS